VVVADVQDSQARGAVQIILAVLIGDPVAFAPPDDTGVVGVELGVKTVALLATIALLMVSPG
jgi:hypothetical protein